MGSKKIILKTFLFFSIASFFLHLYISNFSQDLCFWNTGIIFGLANFLNPFLLSAILISFLLFAIYILWQPCIKYWEVLVVLGISSFSNILDRLLHAGVCDYIDIKIFFDFPIFNLNDIFISISLTIILLIVIYDSTQSTKTGR